MVAVKEKPEQSQALICLHSEQSIQMLWLILGCQVVFGFGICSRSLSISRSCWLIFSNSNANSVHLTQVAYVCACVCVFMCMLPQRESCRNKAKLNYLLMLKANCLAGLWHSSITAMLFAGNLICFYFYFFSFFVFLFCFCI